MTVISDCVKIKTINKDFQIVYKKGIPAAVDGGHDVEINKKDRERWTRNDA